MQWPTINEWRKSEVPELTWKPQSVQLMEHLQKYIVLKSNHKNYIFLGIDISMQFNAGDIFYADVGVLGHQNNAQHWCSKLVYIHHYTSRKTAYFWPIKFTQVTPFAAQQIHRKQEKKVQKIQQTYSRVYNNSWTCESGLKIL